MADIATRIAIRLKIADHLDPLDDPHYEPVDRNQNTLDTRDEQQREDHKKTIVDRYHLFSEAVDWDRIEVEDPELYKMLDQLYQKVSEEYNR